MGNICTEPLTHQELIEIATKPLHLTTGDVKRILGCSQRQVIKLCDSRKLENFHPPGSSHRRISRESLSEFARKQSINIPPLTPVSLEPEHSPNADLKPTTYCDSFSLGQRMIGQPVTKIVLSEALLGNLERMRETIIDSCERHQYPVPEMVEYTVNE